MPRAAAEIMQEILFAAVVDGIAALKDSAKGVPNTLLREIQGLHLNTTFADLPKELQASIATSVRSAFTRLLREGYAVSPSSGVPAPPPPRDRTGPRPESRGPRGPRPGGPRNGGRPGGGPGGGPRGNGPKGPRKPRSS